jgi:hypothetical protein
VPKGTRVTVLADRGFGDQKRYALVLSLGFHYVIRFRQGILLTDEFGESAPAVRGAASARSCPDAQAGRRHGRLLHSARDRAGARQEVKEAWCLATSRDDLPAWAPSPVRHPDCSPEQKIGSMERRTS